MKYEFSARCSKLNSAMSLLTLFDACECMILSNMCMFKLCVLLIKYFKFLGVLFCDDIVNGFVMW